MRRGWIVAVLWPVCAVADGAKEQGLVSDKVEAPLPAKNIESTPSSPANRSGLPALQPQETPRRLQSPRRPGEKLVETTRQENWLQAGMDELRKEKGSPTGEPKDRLAQPRERAFLDKVDPLDPALRDIRALTKDTTISGYTAVWTKEGAVALPGNSPASERHSAYETLRRGETGLFVAPRRPQELAPPAPNPYLDSSTTGAPPIAPPDTRPVPAANAAPISGPRAQEQAEPEKPAVNDRKYFPQMKRF